MSTMASGSLPLDDGQEDESSEKETRTSSPGGSTEIRWEVVAETAGLAPARIIADRLIAEGIPARAWQEGAGQAIGLTVGLLGTGYVVVPEEYVGEAQQILAKSYEEDLDFDDLDDIDRISDTGDTGRTDDTGEFDHIDETGEEDY